MASWREDYVREQFNRAGIRINGPNRWDVHVADTRFYRALTTRGADGFAESYVKGFWNCDAIDECIARIVRSGILGEMRFTFPNLWRYVTDVLRNKQKLRSSRRDVPRHYDLGPVFGIMLDEETMSYSCAYWEKDTAINDLALAQRAKLDLVCRKLGLRPGIERGMSLLDIGCGWGGLIRHAAEHYGASCHGITLSSEQFDYIKRRKSEIEARTTSGSISIQLADYRTLRSARFDTVVSVGMFEHVGPKNYREFMEIVAKCLRNDGLFLLHTIGACDPSPTLNQPELTWVGKHIFPGAALPGMGQICTAADGIFTVLDVQNFGVHYDKTLMAWARRFKAGWTGIKEFYPQHFYRMWTYYLCSCAGVFRSGKLSVWQIVFAKGNYPHLYEAVR